MISPEERAQIEAMLSQGQAPGGWKPMSTPGMTPGMSQDASPLDAAPMSAMPSGDVDPANPAMEATMSAPPQMEQQQGMAGLGQLMRGGYDKMGGADPNDAMAQLRAKLSALRG